jgi:hypothetical protein
MAAYDFTTLSPIDFEILVRDLLQREFGFTLESFKPGKDWGIDLRRFTAPGNTLIVQCKQYAASGLEALLRDLERHEVPKVKKLKPKRYVLATSVPLSPSNKQTICDIFKPYCGSPGDVYGRDDLNNLLGQHGDIERQHLKLWITSTSVLESIIHSQLINTSREELGKIQRRSKVYVYNQSFAEALQILNNRNFCIIAGIPGIGKTTLAEMLVLYFLTEGFELIRITSNIREASTVSGKKRRIFYYDDFLGQSSDADKFEKNEDQRLLDFFETIRSSRVSKLILTTREYILNQARRRYEKLARASFELETYIVDLAKYTRMNRAEILFNHVFFSDLPVPFKQKLLENRGYLKIIDHENYNPRFVDLLTQTNSVLGLPEERYLEFFLENLSNPHRLWSHAFENQLTAPARDILIVLTSMPRQTLLNDLRSAFVGFSQARRAEFAGASDPNDFMTGCKELDGNFVSFLKYREGISVQFHNPSVRDFLQGYCHEHPVELGLLLKGAVFFEQLAWLATYTRKDEEEPAFKTLLLDNIHLWVTRLRDTIEGSSCATSQHFDYAVEGLVPTKAILSFESRVQRLVGLQATYKSPAFDHFLETCLAQVRERAAAKKSKQDDILSLVESFGDLPSDFPEESNVAAAAKELLYGSTVTLRDFQYLDRLRLIRPEAFDEDETERIKDEFEAVLGRELDVWLEGGKSQSPDEVRDCATLIERIGDWLEVDTSDQAAQLRDYASELEDDSDWEPDSDEYRPSGQREATDAEIDSLFKSLPIE